MSSRLTVVGPESVVCFFYRLEKKDIGSVLVPRQMTVDDRPRPLVDGWDDYKQAKIKKAKLQLPWQLGYDPRGYFQ